MYRILVINPGSTTTKVAYYEDETEIFRKELEHSASQLAQYKAIPDQIPMRREAIDTALTEKGIRPENLDAFSAMCTGLLPMPGGVYEVNEKMYEHGLIGPGSRHPGNLGPLLAKDFADRYGGRAFVVDPSSTDEFFDEARLTGFPQIIRTSRGHPLNQRAVARQFAKDSGCAYEELNLIVVHMGGGISVAAHCKGKMIECIDSTRGEGRMAPTRSGAAPVADIINMCFSGKYTRDEMLAKVMKTGGWTAHLGTSSAKEVEERIAEGNQFADLVFRTTAYQIAKDIYACAACLCGHVNAILFTGGIARSERFVALIKDRTDALAPGFLYPGEYEMDALAHGAIRVLSGIDQPRYYTGADIDLSKFHNPDMIRQD